jgi:hypothetical protein
MGLYAVLRRMVMTRKEQIESSGKAPVSELFSLCAGKNMLT